MVIQSVTKLNSVLLLRTIFRIFLFSLDDDVPVQQTFQVLEHLCRDDDDDDDDDDNDEEDDDDDDDIIKISGTMLDKSK